MSLRKETWKNNRQVEVYRDAKGRFAKKPSLIMQKRYREDYRQLQQKKRKMVYRVSFAVNGVQASGVIRGRAESGRYLGFLLQVFHNNQEILRMNIRNYKDKLLKLMEDYLHYHKSEWWFNFSIGTEYPTEIADTIFSLSGTWLFQVEKDGAIIHSETGAI